MKRLLVLAPHPDDETLGVGRIIAAHARRRRPLMVVALTDGQASHPGSKRWPPKRLGQRRRGELRRALARLGAGRAALRFMGWQDLRLAEQARPLRLRRLVAEFRPDLILTADEADHHPDHKAAHALAARLGRRFATVPVWAKLGTPGLPRSRGPHRAAKAWATAAYRSQMPGVIDDAQEAFTFAPDVLALLRDTAESVRAGRAR